MSTHYKEGKRADGGKEDGDPLPEAGGKIFQINLWEGMMLSGHEQRL